MRFYTVIATTILSATVSGAAIDNRGPAKTPEVAKTAPETTEVEVAPKGFKFYEEEEDEEELSKRKAKHPWVWSVAYRPIGLPVGKREVEVQSFWGWSSPYRPIGMPIGKRYAETEAKFP